MKLNKIDGDSWIKSKVKSHKIYDKTKQNAEKKNPELRVKSNLDQLQ